MPGEITVTASLVYVKGAINKSLLHVATAIDLIGAGARYHAGVQSIGTSEEALKLGDLSGNTLGFAMFRNLGTTNFVEIRVATATADLIKLKPGEIALFRFADGVTAPFAIGDTAASDLESLIIED